MIYKMVSNRSIQNKLFEEMLYSLVGPRSLTNSKHQSLPQHSDSKQCGSIVDAEVSQVYLKCLKTIENMKHFTLAYSNKQLMSYPSQQLPCSREIEWILSMEFNKQFCSTFR